VDDNQKYYLVKRKSGKWHIRYWDDNGKECSRTTGTKNHTVAGQILNEFLSEKDIQGEMTLSRLLEQFLNTIGVNYADSVKKNYRQTVKRFLSENVDKNINEYKVLDFDRYFANYLVNRSPYTVSLHKRCLNRLFQSAVNWNYARRNPVSISKRIKLPEPETKCYTHEQFSNLIKAIDEYPETVPGMKNEFKKDGWKTLYKDLFTFAVLSGLRFNEIQHIKTEHLLIDKKLIKVLSSAAHRGKTGNTRFVEFHPELLHVYNRYSEKEYLFTSVYGNKLNSRRISRLLKKFNKAAGNPPYLNFKSFRSTFGQWLIDAGESLEYVAAQLGHSSVRTTERHYAKYTTKKYTGRITALNL